LEPNEISAIGDVRSANVVSAGLAGVGKGQVMRPPLTGESEGLAKWARNEYLKWELFDFLL
jgi:hypothetical protein